MGLEHDIIVLGRVSLFRDLNRDQLRLLAFGAEHLSLEQGQDLYQEDDPADCAFIVLDGEIELFRMRGGERVPAGRSGKGTMLGELALITDAHRPTGATARLDSRLMRLHQKLFRRLLEEYPDIAVRVQRVIVRHLEELLEGVARLEPAFRDSDDAKG
jgi:CRP-like cAMP-binding protein